MFRCISNQTRGAWQERRGTRYFVFILFYFVLPRLPVETSDWDREGGTTLIRPVLDTGFLSGWNFFVFKTRRMLQRWCDLKKTRRATAHTIFPDVTHLCGKHVLVSFWNVVWTKCTWSPSFLMFQSKNLLWVKQHWEKMFTLLLTHKKRVCK